MSTDFILGLPNGTVIHFAKAADGSQSVELAPVTKASFGNPETNVMIFTSAADASAYKDKLCHNAVDLEMPTNRTTMIVPHSLETYCELSVTEFEPELAMA